MTVEYVMLDHINDSTDDAHQLAEVLKDTPCKINLIPWNPFPAPLRPQLQQPGGSFLQGVDGIRLYDYCS